MQSITTRFGTIHYGEEDVVTFIDGLIGFPDLRRFVLLSHKPESPFRWLQSLEEAKIAFLVCDPAGFVQNYEPSISESTAQELGLMAETPRFMFTTANIPHGQPEEMTLNLAGPIVINAESRQAKQLVIEDEAYTIKHRVFQPAESRVAA